MADDPAEAPPAQNSINSSMVLFLSHLQAQIHEKVTADLDLVLEDFRDEMKRLAASQVALALKETDVLKDALRTELGELGLMEDGVVKGSMSPGRVDSIFQKFVESPAFTDAVNAQCSSMAGDVASLGSRVGELEQRVIDDLLMDVEDAAEQLDDDDEAEEDEEAKRREQGEIVTSSTDIFSRKASAATFNVASNATLVVEEATALAKAEAEAVELRTRAEAEAKTKEEAKLKAKEEGESTSILPISRSLLTS